MPGWHDATRELQESGRLQVVGLIQEQHPDRCRLFQEWHRIRWPILVDSLNLLGVSAVPLAFFLDEHGIIRSSRRPTREDLAEFLARDDPAPPDLPAPRSPPDVGALAKRAAALRNDAAAQLALGDALFLRGAEGDLAQAIAAYRSAIARGAPPAAHFRLGVALKRRHETTRAAPGDFRAALEAWERAVAADPNQYVWRRRIQQYGPRLEKPYSFYDWVRQARKEIVARGDIPPPLRVEPGGAELAHPEKRFEADEKSREEPDPLGRIRRDGEPLIRIEPAVAPALVRPGRVARVHLVLRPHPENDGHWNNEGDPLEVWLRPPAGFEIVRDGPPVAPKSRKVVSDEVRTREWEVKLPPETPSGTVRVPGYALYSVCRGRDGVCTYLRQDFTVELRVGDGR